MHATRYLSSIGLVAWSSSSLHVWYNLSIVTSFTNNSKMYDEMLQWTVVKSKYEDIVSK
jgi:hypothetical protein